MSVSVIYMSTSAGKRVIVTESVPFSHRISLLTSQLENVNLNSNLIILCNAKDTFTIKINYSEDVFNLTFEHRALLNR